MRRRTALASIIAVSTLVAATAASAQSGTTRIEPRPFYGATVTLEEGVRVFRPLPPTRHVIVNPGSRTPLNLSINETRTVEHSYNYHYVEGQGATGYARVGAPGLLAPRRAGSHHVR